MRRKPTTTAQAARLPAALVAALLLALPAVAGAQESLDEMAIRAALVEQSKAAYDGNCPCPENRMRNGAACGRRSAWNRLGGAAPWCYPDDVPQEAVERERARRAAGGSAGIGGFGY